MGILFWDSEKYKEDFKFMNKILQKSLFVIRFRYLSIILSTIRKSYFGMFGMKVGHDTKLPSIQVTWPHKVSIGNNCQLESDIFFKFDDVWKKGPSICIGNNVFIGANCEFNIQKKWSLEMKV